MFSFVFRCKIQVDFFDFHVRNDLMQQDEVKLLCILEYFFMFF